jgi:hypothetical protein
MSSAIISNLSCCLSIFLGSHIVATHDFSASLTVMYSSEDFSFGLSGRSGIFEEASR